MKETEIIEIKVEAVLGGEISTCIKECMELAVEQWKTVTLTHNCVEYKIDPITIFNSILETKRNK